MGKAEMNKDDEWIPMDQVKKDINRALELDVELERCQELNAQGEECLADNDIAKAEEYFTQADEALDKMDSEISSLEISGLVDEEYKTQARTTLGLARCWASKVPGSALISRSSTVTAHAGSWQGSPRSRRSGTWRNWRTRRVRSGRAIHIRIRTT